jgi:hypothetical protein
MALALIAMNLSVAIVPCFLSRKQNSLKEWCTWQRQLCALEVTVSPTRTLWVGSGSIKWQHRVLRWAMRLDLENEPQPDAVLLIEDRAGGQSHLIEEQPVFERGSGNAFTEPRTRRCR